MKKNLAAFVVLVGLVMMLSFESLITPIEFNLALIFVSFGGYHFAPENYKKELRVVLAAFVASFVPQAGIYYLMIKVLQDLSFVNESFIRMPQEHVFYVPQLVAIVNLMIGLLITAPAMKKLMLKR